ncbi:DNA-directed RNA polymerase III subunit RPC8 [Dictyocoela muelleri]|nr:DNA-directed RNA polymerase III subunit RPC8 [Dictyocoela muelleri]
MLIKINGNEKLIISPLDLNERKMIEELDKNLLYKISDYLILKVTSLPKINKIKIVDSFLKIYLNYEAIAVKFFEDELLVGKVISQDENGLRIECPFFRYAFIHYSDFMENCKFLKDKKIELWSWWYKNNVYYFKNGDFFRFKVKNVDYKNRNLYGRINENGLGALRWWI